MAHRNLLILTACKGHLPNGSLFGWQLAHLVAILTPVVLSRHRVGVWIGKGDTDYGTSIRRIGYLWFQTTHHALCMSTRLVVNIKVGQPNAYTPPTKDRVPVQILQESWYWILKFCHAHYLGKLECGSANHSKFESTRSRSKNQVPQIHNPALKYLNAHSRWL